MTPADPKFEPRRIAFFSEWFVQVTWPGGRKEQVYLFKSEAHAKGWIETESQAWIAAARSKRG